MQNKDLNIFFENEVKLSRRETSKAKRYVLEKVNQLLKFINKEDPRFGDRPVRVGSSFQGLKTKSPDEFDFNIVLVGLGEFHLVPGTERFYGFSEPIDKDSLRTTPTDIEVVSTRVPLPDPPIGYTVISIWDDEDIPEIWQNRSDLTFDGHVIPYLVRKQLKDLLLKAIRELGLRGELRLGRKVNGPALTVRIPYDEDGIEEITVDFAPTIPNCEKLADRTNWPPSKTRWPSSDKVHYLKTVRLCGIAKEPFDWLLSFVECEEILMEDIDSDGGCRKQALRIMKRFKEMYWCKTSKPVISSYHLKNILFLECEQYPTTEDWSQDMLSTRINSMTEKLHGYVNNKRLPQYFNRKVNLIRLHSQGEKETLALEKRNIGNFLEAPFSFLAEE